MLRRAAVSITVLFACSCGGSSVDPPEGGFAPLPSDVELGPMPDSPSARRLAWVVRELNGDAFSIEEIESSFTPELLAGFSAQDLQKALQVLSAKLAPMTVEGVVGTPEEHRI